MTHCPRVIASRPGLNLCDASSLWSALENTRLSPTAPTHPPAARESRAAGDGRLSRPSDAGTALVTTAARIARSWAV
jgi:hypothetical protein